MIKQKLAGTLVALGLIGMTTMTACLKTDNSSTATAWTYATVINASPDTTGTDFYDSAKKLTSAAFWVGDWTILRDVPGVHTYNFTPYGKSSPTYSLGAISYDSSSFHTIILYGNNPKVAKQWTETFTGTRSDSANLRFFNLVPTDSIGAVDVYINNKKLFANKTYTPSSGFFTDWTLMTSATNASVQVKLHTNDSLLINKVVSFSTGHAYQLFFRGNPSAKDTTKLALGVAEYQTY